MSCPDRKAPPLKYKTVYRPIIERESALLEIQSGCSYRGCVFCDFARDDFIVYSMDRIKANLQALVEDARDKTMIFLLGQNALSLESEALLEIMFHVKQHLPAIKAVNLYGRIDDINKKGVSDMERLKSAGLNRVHIGVESGSDSVLTLMNKGVSRSDMLQAFKILDNCGLNYHITYILGLGGLALWREHVDQTASLFNAINPASIWTLALKLWPDTPLFEEAREGRFLPLSPEQMLYEEKLILEKMHGQRCLYMDTTVLGEYTLIGALPEGKAEIMAGIHKLLKPYGTEALLK